MPFNVFLDLVKDPSHAGKDFILDHPDTKGLFENMHVLGNGMTIDLANGLLFQHMK